MVDKTGGVSKGHSDFGPLNFIKRIGNYFGRKVEKTEPATAEAAKVRAMAQDVGPPPQRPTTPAPPLPETMEAFAKGPLTPTQMKEYKDMLFVRDTKKMMFREGIGKIVLRDPETNTFRLLELKNGQVTDRAISAEEGNKYRLSDKTRGKLDEVKAHVEKEAETPAFAAKLAQVFGSKTTISRDRVFYFDGADGMRRLYTKDGSGKVSVAIVDIWKNLDRENRNFLSDDMRDALIDETKKMKG